MAGAGREYLGVGPDRASATTGKGAAAAGARILMVGIAVKNFTPDLQLSPISHVLSPQKGDARARRRRDRRVREKRRRVRLLLHSLHARTRAAVLGMLKSRLASYFNNESGIICWIWTNNVVEVST